MFININAVDLQWQGHYGEGGAGSGGTGLSESYVQSMINSAISGVNTVTMEQVQEAIKAADTGGSVDLPWSEIQIGYVSRDQIVAYNGGVPANSVSFNVPYPKPFSKPPVVIARGDMDSTRFDTQMRGGTATHFIMQTNYGAGVTGVHFIAFVPKG